MEDTDVFRVGELAKFTLDLDDNTFCATVTSPSNEQIECTVEETDNGNCMVQFVPTKIGVYLIKVFKGSSIPISQFTYTIVDQDKNPNTFTNESGIYNSGTAGTNSQNQVFRVGEVARFTVKMEAKEEKILPTVISPCNVLVCCEMEEIDETSFKITFVPEQCGDYIIKIYKGNNIISQITIKVVDLKKNTDHGTHKDCDLNQDCTFQVGELVKFTVNIEESKNKISAIVTTPSNVQGECSVEEIDDATCKVRFVPQELGDYVITIYKNNQSISQFTIKVGNSTSDTESIAGKHYHGGRIFTVGEVVSFTVNVEENQCKKTFTASVTSPTNMKIPCTVKELPDGSCKVRFTPKEHGEYVIKVFQNNFDVPVQQFIYKVAGARNAAAFEINVNLNVHQTKTAAIGWQPDIADAFKCIAEGHGLWHAKVGETANFTIDTSKAKRGAILVGVEGPVIPAKEIIVKHVGKQVYSVDYILEKVGNYVLHVLFNDNHIKGSPFHVKV